MKNFTIGLNVILVMAVAILFYLQFSSKKTNTALAATNTPGNASFKIAYFEMDSVQNNFEYYKQVAKELGLSQQQKQNELATKKNAYLAKGREYQQKAPTMTQAEATQAQQDMAERERDYQIAEQTKGQEMQEESVRKLQDVKRKIEDFLKQYNKDKRYSFIFQSNPDLMYYKDTVYNITNDLVKGLNEQYKKKN
jgi:outer membrane protein